MEVYLDVLLLENLVINYLILTVTARFSRIQASKLRIFFGAMLGAMFVAALVVFPGVRFWHSTVAKLLLSLAIVVVAFPPESISGYFKTLVVFYLSSFIFAGASFAFLYFNQSGGWIRNGVMIFFGNSKWTILMLSIMAAVIIIRVFWEFIQFRIVKQSLLVPVNICFEEKKIAVSALIDTGNSLVDPLSRLPVMIAEFKAIKHILPEDICRIYDESRENDLPEVTSIVAGSRWYPRFRLIPFASLGKENGILIGFKPDYVEIGEDESKKSVCDVIIGIYNHALSNEDRYNALLGPDIV